MGTENKNLPRGFEAVSPDLGRTQLALDVVRQRSATLAWTSVGLFALGLCIPLSGEVSGFVALMLGWSGPTALAWSAAPLFFWSVGSVIFKKPGLVTATLAMLAFLTTPWFLPLLDQNGRMGVGFVVWTGCVVLNFARAIYHTMVERQIRLAAAVPSALTTQPGYVDYPRDLQGARTELLGVPVTAQEELD